MATPRCQLIDPDVPLCYHLVSRCVRRSWLCGFDRHTQRDYSHRKDWLLRRLKQLASAFAVDVYAYAIMSNHFHLVVYYDPNAAKSWTTLEVAQRWLQICPPKLLDGTVDESRYAIFLETLLADPARIENVRAKLGSLSVFMKFLKQPIARRANLEDQCGGHFFEQRFYSGALLSQEAVIAAMAYVDLNPVRAKIARTIAEAKHTSVHERVFARADAVEEYLGPIIAGIGAGAVIQMTLRNYVERLEILTSTTTPSWAQAKIRRWRDQVSTLKHAQRAFGPKAVLKQWIEARGWQMRELPLPQ